MFVCDVCGREGCWGLGWILDVVVIRCCGVAVFMYDVCSLDVV